MELDIGRAELSSRNIHPLQCAEVDEIDACSAVHQHFFELEFATIGATTKAWHPGSGTLSG